MARGLIVAAPASGSGKTTVTLGLLRAFRTRGVAVGSVKAGPDYIDPAFHAAASGRPCRNLDPWAMRPETLAALAARAGEDAELVVGEGVMGLFDGAPDGTGSTADLAALTGWPVVLVVDAQGMAASAAALVRGFRDHRPGLPFAGVVFNRVGSARHGRLLAEACAPLGVAVLGALPAAPELALPDRHLGLVQALEHEGLEAFLDGAAARVARHLDLERLAALAQPCRLPAPGASGHDAPLPPLGQRIAVARDAAFAFAYPFVLEGWRARGAELAFFSPLAGEGPDPAADAVYLPGGYPELHPERIAANDALRRGLDTFKARGFTVYGECGGYMVLGQGLVDAKGTRHEMTGLLPLESSFEHPRMTLGYRAAELAAAGPLGLAGQGFRGHEFHFARVIGEEGGGAAAGDSGEGPLFRARDAAGRALGPLGWRRGPVMGSFLHLVDRAQAPAAASAPAPADVS